MQIEKRLIFKGMHKKKINEEKQADDVVLYFLEAGLVFLKYKSLKYIQPNKSDH